MELYPFAFEPILQDRIWGGSRLAELYGKKVTAGSTIGESWEVSDRPDASSVVINGPLAGKSLRWLMEHHAAEILGQARSIQGRFPLLIKLLDARQKLSLQVHPPANLAAAMGGEPKTEIWYFSEADPGAEILAGIKRGLTKEEFARKTLDGTVADCFHTLPVKTGDCMFLPSGRVHALGQGMVIFEIQQNSDTTYRVFDWNRTDASGQKRQLHVDQSLKCIDFADFEPALTTPKMIADINGVRINSLADNELFRVELASFSDGSGLHLSLDKALIVASAEGSLMVRHGQSNLELRSGSFALVPASLGRVEILAVGSAKALLATPG